MYVSVCMCVNYMHALSSSLIVSLTCAHLCLREEEGGRREEDEHRRRAVGA